METEQGRLRFPFEEIEARLYAINRKLGFGEEDARLIAHTHTQSSCDGVESHGLNRFPRFAEYVQSGYIRVDGEMTRTSQVGALEKWNGHQRSGVLNAHQAINRAITLARTHGLGAVALSHTNHWMRGGTYGWIAAEHDCMAICMTNTIPNMAPWGSQKNMIGNNPLVLAVPRKEGHVVLDMATSQYSYGKMEDISSRGEMLSYYGGWDGLGKLTRDPDAILQGGQVLPVGLWKGTGLTILMDLMVSLLSEGESTHQIGQRDYETNLSQFFLCIDMGDTHSQPKYQDAANGIIQSIHDVAPPGGDVYYPGERTIQRRLENLEKGIPVDPAIWEEITSMEI